VKSTNTDKSYLASGSAKLKRMRSPRGLRASCHSLSKPAFLLVMSFALLGKNINIQHPSNEWRHEAAWTFVRRYV